jgi:hypothetical protein
VPAPRFRMVIKFMVLATKEARLLLRRTDG